MVWQKHGAEVLNCNRQSYGAAKTIWAHNFSFNWLVLKPNLSHFSLKFLHKKYVFRTFRGLSGGGRSRSYKRLCTRVSLQNAVRDTSHPETRTSRIERVLCDIVGKGNLSMDSLNLGETWLSDKMCRNLVEWDTFKLSLVIACDRQNRCDKSTAQRFWTAIVRAMGQQKWSKRTTSNSIDWFWTKSVPFFRLKVSK